MSQLHKAETPVVDTKDMHKYKSIAPTAVINDTVLNPLSSQPMQKSVPAFLNKLYSMVNDPTTDELICWAEDGTSFFVNRQEDFARKVLPRFFKHNKFSSFVRQLNMYGFHKVPHLQQGLLHSDSEFERWEFSNPHFQRNQPDLLLLVTRKKGNNHEEKELSSMEINHILDEIQSIKKHQTNISGQLQAIQHDNQALWQETVTARERHLRHQETIDKILRFLASVFSSEKRSAIPRKRRYLIEPAEDNRSTKISKHNEIFDLDDYTDHKVDVTDHTGHELEEAIALNNQSKEDTPPNYDSQLQNLQHLISLARSSPDIANQLTHDTFYSTPPSNPLHDNITVIAETADALNHDIDNLDLSIQALAHHLGFDPSKLAANVEEEEILNMDDFLHTYASGSDMESHAVVEEVSTNIPKKD